MSGARLGQYRFRHIAGETHLGTQRKQDRLSDRESRLVDWMPQVVSPRPGEEDTRLTIILLVVHHLSLVPVPHLSRSNPSIPHFSVHSKKSCPLVRDRLEERRAS